MGKRISHITAINLFGSSPPPPHTHTLKCYVVWEFPGSSLVRTLHSLLRAWVKSLVKELRSSSYAMWPKRKKENAIYLQDLTFLSDISIRCWLKFLLLQALLTNSTTLGGTQVNSAVYLMFAIICNHCNPFVNF